MRSVVQGPLALAKQGLDVGFATNQAAEQEHFWGSVVGLELESRLEVSAGQMQLRYGFGCSVIKVNCFREPLPQGALTGYRNLLLATPGLERPRRLQDPDGNDITLVPLGHNGVSQLGLSVLTPDMMRYSAFIVSAFGLVPSSAGLCRIGQSLLLIREDKSWRSNPGPSGIGLRYATLQVFDVEAAHQQALAGGASEACTISELPGTARFSILRDPDGNAIELSQRADLTSV